ncbi:MULTISPECIES: aminotransferase class IV [unclassified Agrococcus]|uniref:aminotransferase class IV n=1 Tax=unclassified Agrococcus TaxID=2615065 RepID=UPI00361689CE
MSGAAATTRAGGWALAFDGDRFAPVEAPAGDPLVADSWLVRDGGVVGWATHVDRFVASATAQGGDAEVAARAAAAVPHAVPATGTWFPRLDWVRDAERDAPVLHVRPAPTLGRRVRVRTASHDPRTTPTIKGPDLTALGALRAEARAHGADEAAIVVDGRVVDGATTAFAWWREGTLRMPPGERERVASVTAGQLTTLALALGTPVVEEDATPASLVDAEVWAVNALHGVRGVAAWAEADGTHHPLAAPTRADAWHAALERLRRPWT